jgi:hypothetical protein
MNTKDEALKMAIEALEKLARLGNGDSYGNSVGNCIAISTLKAIDEAIEQPAPKNCTPLDEYIAEMEKDPEIKQLLDIAREDVKKWSTQPILAPSWQGLSDDERQNIIKELSGYDFDADNYDVAVFVEQALKEKNTP